MMQNIFSHKRVAYIVDKAIPSVNGTYSGPIFLSNAKIVGNIEYR